MAKRSALFGSDNIQKTISFLAITRSALGEVHTNFDAETINEELKQEEYLKPISLGFGWSETFQTSRLTQDAYERIENILRLYRTSISMNLVIGNAAYGLNPSSKSLEQAARRLAPLCDRVGLKLGAEGWLNGVKVIDLAKKIGASAYILHTPLTGELLHYAKSKRIDSIVYTLCRIGKSREEAMRDLIQIKGDGYFNRRGISRESIPMRLGDYALFGTTSDISEQILSIQANGGTKVALYLVSQNLRDLVRQFSMLSSILA